ncbi:hypothetical protein [Streptomyces sp. SGAir0957]
MTEFEVPGPEPDWQPATQPPYGTGRNPASQYSVWEHVAPLFQLIGGVALPVQPIARRLCLRVERSWDGLDELDVALFRLRGFSFAISTHDGNPLCVSSVWLTEPHAEADQALDTLLKVVGIGQDAVVFRGDPREGPRDDPAESTATAQESGVPGDLPTAARPTSPWWARLRRATGMPPAPNKQP